MRNRLIDDFKKLSRPSLWHQLNAMGANYAVFSIHAKGLPPYFPDNDVYLYCSDTSVVVVAFDQTTNHPDNIYCENESLDPFIYSDDEEPRPSIAYKMYETLHTIRTVLDKSWNDIAVFGVLLTESMIVNAPELKEMWEEHGFIVLDNLSRLKRQQLTINEDPQLLGRTYAYDIICNALDTKSGQNQTDAPVPPAEDNTNEGNGKEEKTKFISFNDYLNTLLTYEEVADLSDEVKKRMEKDYYEEEPELFLLPRTEDDDNSPLGKNHRTGEEREKDTDESKKEPVPNPGTPEGRIKQNDLTVVKVEVIPPIDNPSEELEKLIGCNPIKHRIEELIALTKYNKLLSKHLPHNKHHHVSLHSIFLGRPGTGKTTVCKIFGALLHKAGALSKGHVVICDRSTFLGTLWGDEERAVNQALEMAAGGVLMIDEAYLFNSKNQNDPANIIIQLMMNALADESRRDIAVVLCGYKEPMMKLLSTNPGLQSRFPNMFEFQDFTIDELLEITKLRTDDFNYQFSPDAWDKYCDIVKKDFLQRNPATWGNARYIANLLEHIYTCHAIRCVSQKIKRKKDLLTLTTDDIVPIEMPQQEKKIGF